MTKFIEWFSLLRKYLLVVVFRNVFTFINGIFVVVTLMLFFFGQFQESLFLGSVTFLNVVIGTIQDLRAKMAMERIILLMTPKITRLGKEYKKEIITPDQIAVGDHLEIKLGDQIPTDGVLIEANGLEMNEALLTGESGSLTRQKGDQVKGGSIITSGWGIIKASVLPKDSFVVKMTEKIKKYKVNLSPIQRMLKLIVKYTTYILLLSIIYVIIRGLSVHQLMVSIIRNIAALTGTLVPQGLVLATTIFFAYGAVIMFKRNVLLQEINATEKLGRIKNLCIDKTGTLTENKPLVDNLVLYKSFEREEADQLCNAYIHGSADSSETAKAIKDFLKYEFTGEIIDSTPFSSDRKYGITTLKLDGQTKSIVVGAPDILLNYFENKKEKDWLQHLVDVHAKQSKRLVLLAESSDIVKKHLLDKITLHPIALFVLSNPLRNGTKDIISFLQSRGVQIRVISGDNPKTVEAIAKQAGIKYSNMVITGPEIAKWTKDDFKKEISKYHLFARISPNQKERIVKMLKKSGFTAMVGDGANDSLAIKEADLGIAMFDGADATRRIAQIVLMNNSFAALPTGIEMAETIITSLEMVASIFIYSVLVGFVLFTGLSLLGYSYPISPRNITVINFITITVPLMYWAIFPAHKIREGEDSPFFGTIFPFALFSSIVTGITAIVVFETGPTSLENVDSNVLVVLTILYMGFWFFLLTPSAYGVKVEMVQKKALFIIATIAVTCLAVIFDSAGLSDFFTLQWPGLKYALTTFAIVAIFSSVQYIITRLWFKKSA